MTTAQTTPLSDGAELAAAPLPISAPAETQDRSLVETAARQVRHARPAHHGAVNFDVLLEHYMAAELGKNFSVVPPHVAQARQELGTMLSEFQKAEGKIRSQTWGPKVGTGAVLTSRPRTGPLHRLHDLISGEEIRYFSGGDPIETPDDLQLGRLGEATDREAQRVEDFLRNPMRRNALNQLFAVRATVFEAFEEIAKGGLKGQRAREIRDLATGRVREDLRTATAYAEAAMRRRAQLLYLGGMAVGAVALIIVAWLLMQFYSRQASLLSGTEAVPIALVLGSLGAVISVLQRMTAGQLRISLDKGQGACFLLGVFRPTIGSVLALGIVLLVLGGIVPLEVPDEAGKVPFFLAGLAFLAGFSERYAQDMMGSARIAATPSDAGSSSDTSSDKST